MGLCISRKDQEAVKLKTYDGVIWIRVVRIGPNNVRLLIDAPSSVNIVREELLPPPVAEAATDVKGGA